MGVHRLNHAVLHVRDAAISKRFYCDVLGFSVVKEFPGAVFLQAPDSTNDHDLGLFSVGADATPSASGRGSVGMYHLAWEVDTLGELAELAETLRTAGALVGSSDHGTTKSLYAKDPDGLEFEVVWLIPANDLTEADIAASASISPLNLDVEVARFGSSAKSGIGVSRTVA